MQAVIVGLVIIDSSPCLKFVASDRYCCRTPFMKSNETPQRHRYRNQSTKLMIFSFFIAIILKLFEKLSIFKKLHVQTGQAFECTHLVWKHTKFNMNVIYSESCSICMHNVIEMCLYQIGEVPILHL